MRYITTMIRPLLLPVVLLAGCFAGAAMHELTLPMSVPAAQDLPAPKGEPLRVGTTVEVPDAARAVPLDALEWSGDAARLTVRWPAARGIALRLHADGRWHKATEVRALSVDGEPLHADVWRPAQVSDWTTPSASGDAVILEITNPPGRDARLFVVSASTRIRR
jgi:hypothetical protein